ncbi:MAG TPA: phosphate regulon sensor histidine kinase PhoR [Burkholderiaceae bacterium]|nr:phosphate regulon sensor histidine kinase PhoR [Burkholderiaceae bacterium]
MSNVGGGRFRVILPAVVRLAILGAICAGAGWLWQARVGLWLAAVGLAVLYLGQLFYLGALGNWLERPSLSSIPNGIGAWGEVFARLYRQQRASEIAQQRLIDNEERFRHTISALPDGIILIDASLQIEWCNPVAELHLGVSLKRDQGLRLTNLVRDPPFVAYLGAGRYEQPLLFSPLSLPGATLSLTVVEFEPARSIVVTRDITQSERVDAMRRDFVANVSHELRTPLTVIKGFLEAMIDGGSDLDPTRLHHLHLMYEQGDRMHRLVEDLLTLSRLESQQGPDVEEDVDAGMLVSEVADEARTLSAGRHRINVEVQKLKLRGGRDEMRSAYSNLVSNAVRYTPVGGHITLRCIEQDGGIALQVQDTGIGVAKEHIPRLTERFYRVDKSRSRETGGTGLGLAIVKHVLIRHQARLDVQSEIGKGSLFSAWFPPSRRIPMSGEREAA